MSLQQFDLFGQPLHKESDLEIKNQKPKIKNAKLQDATVAPKKRGRKPKLKLDLETPKIKSKRGRKSYTETYANVDLVNIPTDEILNKKLYYPISEVANWFQLTTSQLRFWEREFDILQPRKNKKGDRLFRPEDIKNLKTIYHLLRIKKQSIEGAKDYLKANQKNIETHVQLQSSLNNLKSFLLEIKANL